jgi:hypothetical protein
MVPTVNRGDDAGRLVPRPIDPRRKRLDIKDIDLGVLGAKIGRDAFSDASCLAFTCGKKIRRLSWCPHFFSGC